MSLTLLLSSRTRFSLVNAPPPSAAFILKVFEFYFLFWSYSPPFLSLFLVLFFYCPRHNFVLGGAVSLLPPSPPVKQGLIVVSVSGTVPWSHHNSQTLSCPQVAPSCVHEGVWGGEVVVETRDRHRCLEGFLNYI